MGWRGQMVAGLEKDFKAYHDGAVSVISSWTSSFVVRSEYRRCVVGCVLLPCFLRLPAPRKVARWHFVNVAAAENNRLPIWAMYLVPSPAALFRRSEPNLRTSEFGRDELQRQRS